MNTVAIYCRVDRHSNPESLRLAAAMQKALLEQFAFENQYIVAGCYEDIGYTGRAPSRPGLAALEADYAKGRFDAVLIVNRSRLYRGNIASKPNWPFLIIALDEM